MRIWSIHPEYLDSKGLVALWRESLLAKNILKGNTKGYKNHPQLNRFKSTDNPIGTIENYLSHIYIEAEKRGYNFDKSKISRNNKPVKIKVTKGQLEFETKHLLYKLKLRDPNRYEELKGNMIMKPHPIFDVIDGIIEEWEII